MIARLEQAPETLSGISSTHRPISEFAITQNGFSLDRPTAVLYTCICERSGTHAIVGTFFFIGESLFLQVFGTMNTVQQAKDRPMPRTSVVVPLYMYPLTVDSWKPLHTAYDFHPESICGCDNLTVLILRRQYSLAPSTPVHRHHKPKQRSWCATLVARCKLRT